MCGNFGAFGPRINPLIIRTLGILNESRGRMSAGFFDSNANILKQAKSITDMLKEEATTIYLNGAAKNAWAICGHTRAPSGGTGVTQANAHPFRYAKEGKSETGPIIGCHNGIIQHPKKDTESGEEYTVDSQYIFHQLAKFGPGQYQEALGKVSGWYAIAWYDTRNASAYLLNWKGSLYMVRIGSTVYYSSEAGHLHLATGRAPEITLADDGDVWKFTANKATKEAKFTGAVWQNAYREWERGTERWEPPKYDVNGALPRAGKDGLAIHVDSDVDRFFFCMDGVWRHSEDPDLKQAVANAIAEHEKKLREAESKQEPKLLEGPKEAKVLGPGDEAAGTSEELDRLIEDLSTPPQDDDTEMMGKDDELILGDFEDETIDSILTIDDEAEAAAALKYIQEMQAAGYNKKEIDRHLRRKFPRLANI
jgi:hypothetical protein